MKSHLSRWHSSALFLLLISVLLLGSCGGASAPASSPTVVTSTGTARPSPTPSPTPDPTPTPSSASVAEVQVHFIDVGQGDSVYVATSEGKTALLDGGKEGAGALQYLRDKGVQKLDLMVATAASSEHVGGLAEVLDALPVAEVAGGGQADSGPAYGRFLDAVVKAQTKYRQVGQGDVLSLGGLRLEVLHPPSRTTLSTNNQSLVLRLEHGATAYLFTGDAERDAEASLLSSSASALRADILKVGNHGSRTASTLQFLETVKPKVAVLSAGAGNAFGYPHAETLAALAKVGARVYGSATDGTVVVTSTGSGYTVATSRMGGTGVPPSASPTVATATVQTPPSQSFLHLDIVYVSSPVRRGQKVTLTAKTAPGARISLMAYHEATKTGMTGDRVGTVANVAGDVSLSWTVGGDDPPGGWRLVVTATKDGATVSKEATFTVQ